MHCALYREHTGLFSCSDTRPLSCQPEGRASCLELKTPNPVCLGCASFKEKKTCMAFCNWDTVVVQTHGGLRDQQKMLLNYTSWLWD